MLQPVINKKCICVKNKNYNLTVNKEYDVLHESELYISIKNDKNLLGIYNKNLFNLK